MKGRSRCVPLAAAAAPWPFLAGRTLRGAPELAGWGAAMAGGDDG